MEPILTIDALKKYYGTPANPTRALNGVTCQVMPGEFWGIMGSSGSGKSTLLNCIAAVIRPTSGSIFLKGQPIHTLKDAALADYRGKEIGYLFQNFELLDNLTGRENILLPLSLHKVPEAEGRKRLESLTDYLEVTGALDSKNARALMEKLAGLNREAGATILMVTHDSGAASYCQRILFIQDGRIVHELRRNVPEETRQEFYGRILRVMAQLGGGSEYVL